MSGTIGVRHLLYFAACLSSHLVASQEMGAFDLIWKEVSEIEDVGTGEILIIKPKIVRKGRSETALVMNVTVNRAVDDEVAVRATLSIWGNGGWRPNFFTQKFPSGCQSVFKYCPDAAKELTAQGGVEGCPIPEGDYHLNLSKNKMSNINVPSFMFGKYKADLVFLRQSPSGEEVRVGGLVGVGEIVPKKKKG